MPSSSDFRTPVLVGAGVASQREEDPQRALEPVALMVRALEAAGDDAGSRDLLTRADAIAVPRGFTAYADPARLVAEGLGAKRARSQLAEIGVLQTSLFGRAAAAIRAGDADVVLVTGGEAKYRDASAKRAGVEASVTSQDGAQPDEVWKPAADIVHALEIERGIPAPVHQFSVIDNALRAAEGLSLAEHRREVAELWADFNRVAVDNPHAWNREAVSAEEIAEPSGRNRMLAFPYTKLHTSQWNVDQAAGLVFCSLATARAARIPEDRWIFPRAVVESNHMVSLVERGEPHRSPGFELAGRRAFEVADLTPEDLTHVELYSCFPAAVRVQLRELTLPAGRPLTVTGGMSFAGGPLNNFVLQAVARMVELLREAPRGCGLVTALSGILTKQAVSLWAREPGPDFAFEDVAAEAARRTPTVAVEGDYRGPARVVSSTVVWGPEGPWYGVALCDVEGGRRTLARTEESGLLRALTEEEFAGRAVRVGADGALLAERGRC
jgi:acetyl-CoA C-acetyltransferase